VQGPDDQQVQRFRHRDRQADGRHLYQNVGTVEVGDVDCDTNDVLATDWGQHTMEEDVTPDELLNTPVDQEFSEEIGAALGIEPDANGRYLKKGVTLRTLLMWTDNRVESLKAEVAQAREEIAVLAERPTTATLTPEQLEQLAQRLEERFGAVAQSSVRNALQTMQMNIPSGTATFSPKPPPTGG
ncbi:MAG TPA: hypothetical protein VJ914_40215, partial [Pseudonocardiaceae bacterium]|nr:hypothetical protein [Pseudonocardiaceae bacterium]